MQSFLGDSYYFLPTNACLTERHIPFLRLANHSEPSKIWKVDLDLRTLFTGMVKNNTTETEFERALSTVCSTFKISRLNACQLTAIKEFVRGNSDIFSSIGDGGSGAFSSKLRSN